MPNRSDAFPAQQFIEVEAIKNDAILIKHGGLRKVLAVSGVNFDLKAEEEKELIIGAFQGFLNSLDFPIQILTHSRKVNVERYLDSLAARESSEKNELLKTQITEYREFITSFVRENAIMTKSYFIVVPYDPISLPKSGEAATQKIFSFLRKKGVARPTERLAEQDQTTSEQFTHHLEQLEQRVNQVVSSVNQMGLRAVPLNNEELTDLLYNLYNPEETEKRDLGIPKQNTN